MCILCLHHRKWPSLAKELTGLIPLPWFDELSERLGPRPVAPTWSHWDPSQGAAARLLTGSKKWEHITPVLASHHWLPVQQRIIFNCSYGVQSHQW